MATESMLQGPTVSHRQPSCSTGSRRQMPSALLARSLHHDAACCSGSRKTHAERLSQDGHHAEHAPPIDPLAQAASLRS